MAEKILTDEVIFSILKKKPVAELKKFCYELKKIIHMKSNNKEKKVKYATLINKP